jgi:hypothetical protein
MVVGAGPLNFFMNRLLFVDNSSTEKVEDVDVVEDNSKVLPVEVSRSFSKQRNKEEEEKKKAAFDGDLPSLVRTYFHELAPPLLRGDSFASKSSSSLVSEDCLEQSERSDAPKPAATEEPSIPTRSPSPPTKVEEPEPAPEPPSTAEVTPELAAERERMSLNLNKKFPKNVRRTGSKKKK